MVDLVLLHGPPASGKLTIAKELSDLIGARVFHNHLTIDVAKALFNFGEPEFWDLVHDLRRLALRSFFRHGTEVAVATWCYEEPGDHKMFMEMKSIAADENGRILPVFLNCNIADLEKRVTHAHRRDMEKISNVEHLRKVLSDKNYVAVPDKLCISIDSDKNAAKDSALEIVRQFDL